MATHVSFANLPRKLGRYEVVGHLAAGGMAQILLGRILGPSGFERPVVLKRILPHLVCEPSFRAMFLDEARIVAGIRHPNVVTVHDLGQEEGELFMVLEYLEGESAAGLMRRLALRAEYLDFAHSAHIVAELCAGLHAAHELTAPDGTKQQLVHRDVSPQNVFVTYDGTVKVLDFGIAKAADRSARTETGQVKGKFEYMSPEQCLNRPLDRRSDLFALGVVLYELSTGRRLFRRPNQLLTLRAICDEPIASPSSILRGYPRVLEEVCLRALARKADDRYQTAADMRRALLVALRAIETSSQPHEEGLAALMQRLFSDRIAEKAEMLRRVRLGSDVADLPAAETDGSVEIPIVESEAVATQTASSVPSRLSNRSAARWPWLIALGAAAAVSVLVVQTRSPRDVPPTVSLSPSMPAPNQSSEKKSAAPVDEVALHVDTMPSGATVSVGDQLKGVTPLGLRLTRSEAPQVLAIHRDGYGQLRQSIVANVDQRLLLTLVPVTKANPRLKPPPAAAAPRPSAGMDGFRRFD